MTAYVALFRGINVGGKHILPMQDLRAILAALGCDNVRTCIQSGNRAEYREVKSTSLLQVLNFRD